MSTTTATEYVKARIDRSTKEQAERVLSKLGMSTSDAIRLFYRQVALRKGLPFSLYIPNAVTQQALKRKKISRGFTDAKDMFNDVSNR